MVAKVRNGQYDSGKHSLLHSVSLLLGIQIESNIASALKYTVYSKACFLSQHVCIKGISALSS